MPKRWIKDSIPSSPNLNEVSDFAERLFYRLIVRADDYGRFLAGLRIVKANCFPLRDMVTTEIIEQGLQELVVHGLIDLYQVGDREYGAFVKWTEHQGEPRAKESKYPAPPCAHMQTFVCSGKHLLADVTGGPDTDTESITDTDMEHGILGSAMEKPTFQQIAKRWNEIPGVAMLDVKRTSPGLGVQKRVAMRIKEHPAWEWWDQLFVIVKGSPFLCGQKTDFRATLDWVLRPENLAKTIQGDYEDKPTATTPTAGPTAPPQKKCVWKNDPEPCLEYALLGSSYCQKHKELIVKAQQKAGLVKPPQVEGAAS